MGRDSPYYHNSSWFWWKTLLLDTTVIFVDSTDDQGSGEVSVQSRIEMDEITIRAITRRCTVSIYEHSREWCRWGVDRLEPVKYNMTEVNNTT